MTTVHAGELILLWSNRATKQCYLHISRVGMLKLHEITLHEVREVRIRAILAEVPAQLRTVTRKVSNFTLGEFKLRDSKLPKLQPFSMLLMSLCCESKAPVAFQHKNPIDGKTQHQFQQIHGVEAIVHLVKKKVRTPIWSNLTCAFIATGRFTLRLHPIPMAQHPQAVTQWHDPSTLTRVVGTLPFEFYNVLLPLLSILLFHFFLFHRQLLKDMVKTHALVHVAIGKTSAFPPDSHFFRSFAGHIEPLPQRPIFQVLLFFLQRRHQRPNSTQQLSQDDPVLSAFANGLLWSTDDLLFVLWTIVGNSPFSINCDVYFL